MRPAALSSLRRDAAELSANTTRETSATTAAQCKRPSLAYWPLRRMLSSGEMLGANSPEMPGSGRFFTTRHSASERKINGRAERFIDIVGECVHRHVGDNLTISPSL